VFFVIAALLFSRARGARTEHLLRAGGAATPDGADPPRGGTWRAGDRRSRGRTMAGHMKTSMLAALVVLSVASVARAECPVSSEGVVVEASGLRVAGAIAFDLYGPSLDPAALPVIDAVARRLIACPDIHIEIRVHTDTRRATVFNARQSTAIAALIRDRLIARGVPASRVAACGLGESTPPAGREGWDPLNNRVEWIRVPDARTARCQTVE
jgi:outer membrane protein OmpA-like peptidoglycan-associated protein